MQTLFLIFIGAGLGGVFRYVIGTGVYLVASTRFPYGTLVVNVTGCFLMGFLFVFIANRSLEMASSLRALILIGFLGGYTTFSSFSIETLNLFENGEINGAIINIFLSVFLCMLAVWLGVLVGRQV